jgi:hypothetical protein
MKRTKIITPNILVKRTPEPGDSSGTTGSHDLHIGQALVRVNRAEDVSPFRDMLTEHV